jgi:hypothetical protein
MLFWLMLEKFKRMDFSDAVLTHVREILKQDLFDAVWLMEERS